MELKLLIVILAGISAAALNAWSSVLQRRAAGRPEPAKLFSRHFSKEVTRHPLFLLGLGFQASAAAMQGLALYFGPLTLVEPLLTLDLVFLLLFLYLSQKGKPTKSDWLAAVAIIAGLSTAFVAAAPKGGSHRLAVWPWIVAAAVFGLIVLSNSILIRNSPSAKIRAGLSAVAAACSYALSAGLFKLVLGQARSGNVSAIFSSWPLYAFILAGLASIYLMQNMYGAGPLAISQPVSETVEPALGVTIGIIIFGEHVRTSALALGIITIGLAVLVIGIFKLGSSRLGAGLQN